MTKYYKTYLSLYKTIDTKVYRYYYKTKDWRYSISVPKQELLDWSVIPLTLLDLSMLGIPE